MGKWECEAYGPEGSKVGALCLFADRGTRNCWSQEECRVSVAAARQLMFSQIRELAEQGDPTAIGLAEHFTSPDQLLGGPEDISPADQRTDRP